MLLAGSSVAMRTHANAIAQLSGSASLLLVRERAGSRGPRGPLQGPWGTVRKDWIEGVTPLGPCRAPGGALATLKTQPQHAVDALRPWRARSRPLRLITTHRPHP
jgi:hypothetical protein